jgi:hypothetical protein
VYTNYQFAPFLISITLFQQSQQQGWQPQILQQDWRPLPLIRSPSVESVQLYEENGQPVRWFCFQDECRTPALNKYKSFTRLKNWAAHVERFHNARLEYKDYIETFKPADAKEELPITEFGNLTINKKK